MKLFAWRDGHDWIISLGMSCTAHLAVLIFVAVVLISVADKPTAPIVVEVSLEAPTEIVAMESIRVTKSEGEEAVWTPLPMPKNDLAVEIGQPWDHVSWPASESGGGGGTGGENGEASFFGTSSQGDYFVYILDVSPSMNARAGQRLVRAVQELLRSIAQLREDQHFYVIVFGWETRQMFDDVLPHPEMVPATLRNKRRLRDWLAYIRTIPGTDPRRSLQIALEMMPNAVFLLSDGEFNKPRKSLYFEGEGPDVFDIVRKCNQGQTPINAIAFEDRSSRKAMAKIAALSGGEHRFVPEPGATRPSAHRRVRTTNYSRKISDRYRKAVREFTFGDEHPEALATSR